MEEKKVWICGHKNPDTDSICSAIAYADLKNKLQLKKQASERTKFIPKRAGEVSAETQFVLNYFNAETPELINDVGTQIKDINIRHTEGVDRSISMKKAWELMKILRVVTLPIVNRKDRLEGLIVTGDVATSYMDVLDNTILSRARTQYRNIVETLEGKLVAGNEHAFFVKGKTLVGAGSPDMIAEKIEADDLVIMSNTQEAQLLCIEKNCSCLIVTNGLEISQKVIEAAKMKDIVLISTPYDTFTVSRLINQSMPIKFFMTRVEDIISFHETDYIDDVRDIVAKIRHRDFPVVDNNGIYMGMFSRRHLMNTNKKKIILVDHNEESQAVNNINEAEILEIIDHHRIGSLETMSPVYFRNQPLGCTATIIYQIFQEKGVEIEPNIAGLMCAAIISDTLLFRSPTCTNLDRETCMSLAEIAGISLDDFAEKMFEAGSAFSTKTAEEILTSDFKIFYAGSIAFGVAQVTALNQKELEKVKKRLQEILDVQRESKNLAMLFVMLTNIATQTTTLIYAGAGAAELAAEAFDSIENPDCQVLRGVVSRKKQMIPSLMRVFNERNS